MHSPTDIEYNIQKEIWKVSNGAIENFAESSLSWHACND